MRRLSREMGFDEFIEWKAFLETEGMLQREMAKGKSPKEAVVIVRAMVELHAEQSRE